MTQFTAKLFIALLPMCSVLPCLSEATSAKKSQRTPAEEARAAANSDQVRKRLNQILYWQLADELKLSPQNEKAMVTVIEEIQKRREEALKLRNEAFVEIKNNPGAKDSLKKLRRALSQMGQLDVEEYERLEKVLGTETLARFYIVREKVAEKISQSLKSSPSK